MVFDKNTSCSLHFDLWHNNYNHSFLYLILDLYFMITVIYHMCTRMTKNIPLQVLISYWLKFYYKNISN